MNIRTRRTNILRAEFQKQHTYFSFMDIYTVSPSSHPQARLCLSRALSTFNPRASMCPLALSAHDLHVRLLFHLTGGSHLNIRFGHRSFHSHHMTKPLQLFLFNQYYKIVFIRTRQEDSQGTGKRPNSIHWCTSCWHQISEFRRLHLES